MQSVYISSDRIVWNGDAGRVADLSISRSREQDRCEERRSGRTGAARRRRTRRGSPLVRTLREWTARYLDIFAVLCAAAMVVSLAVCMAAG